MNNEHNKSFQRTVKKLRFLPPAELQRYAARHHSDVPPAELTL